MDEIKPFLFTIFGATGDLTHRKIMPALFRLYEKKQLPKNFSVLGVARREKTDEEFRRDVSESISKYIKKADVVSLKKFTERIYYFHNDFDTDSSCPDLKEFLNNLHARNGTQGNMVFYLATMPKHFNNIISNFHKHKCVDRTKGQQYKIIIEKPFGYDLPTAKRLNKELSVLFKEDEIFRIDHFLGKEAVQNLFALRFANKIFESVWDSEHIDNIQITALENIGVESRGGYYDNYGALKDMVQNHLLQVLSIVAMEPPKSFDTQGIKKEKVKVLENVSIKNIKNDIVYGQYIKGKAGIDYTKEQNVTPGSITDTYVALKMQVNNKRWKGTPFYLRTGKSLKRKASEVVIYFKDSGKEIFGKNTKQNVLVIRLQPNEGIYLRFNAKEPGNEFNLQEVSMDFCHECLFGINTPEAYEKLLFDAFKGDTALFTRWDEVEAAWKIIDPLAKFKSNIKPILYETGSWGPDESDVLLGASGHHWREPM